MKKLLIVDDDREIAELIQIYLANEGYATVLAHDGDEALALASAEPFHLIVLDIMMPKTDGLEVCRQLRREGSAQVPILMLSAKAADMDKIMGLMTGADDYMVKPFNPLELVARVKSLLRRAYQFPKSAGGEGDGAVELGPFVIDKSTHTVTCRQDGRQLHLTSTEFGILHLLASHPGKVFSAEDIFQQVWKEKFYESNNTVMVHISKLRDKLEQETGDKFIVTVWGVGYKIEG
ncbi:response regulator transcription factor [Paenibacillus albicereus]|uniref:Response regulator transcription factor n=1 Tax=Paenibacillus albicereus TaxID=2726185 RepID=A0A6H2GZJ4_9BACL|nr:response regulator transcription factor [Paenibacillus albicereus]QJC52825.1 response regulator transcription factor [Paenibacillus albicereus]